MDSCQFYFRGFIFSPPLFNISTQQEAIFESRRQKIIEVCKKYKMNTGKPSSEIFDTILCFSKYEVSTLICLLLEKHIWLGVGSRCLLARKIVAKIMSRLCDIEINSCAYISQISRLFCSKG